jgi:hypothetical protein
LHILAHRELPGLHLEFGLSKNAEPAIIREPMSRTERLFLSRSIMQSKILSLPVVLRGLLALGIVAAIVGLPCLYYRWTYNDARRFRVVEAGKLYRSGRLTAQGLAEVLQQYKIRTVINLMEEEAEPELPRTFFGGGSVKESQVCEQNGARMVFLQADLVSRRQIEHLRPSGIDQFLKIMDDPSKHPVLLHCRAGLHRTGVLTAVYRMEYDNWSKQRAWLELRKCGFGEWNCFSDNDYIYQYLFTYEPGLRNYTGKLPQTPEPPAALEVSTQEVPSATAASTTSEPAH